MKNVEKLIYLLICIYVIILPLINDSMGIVGYAPDVILITTIGLYFIYMTFSRKNRKKFFIDINDFLTSFIGITMVVLSGLMMLSTYYSVEKKLALSECFRFITYICIVFIVKYEFNNKKKINSLMKCFIFTTTVLVIFGVIQYVTGIGLNEKFILSEGNRITSTMENPNGLGAYLVLSFFPIFMLAFNKDTKRNRSIYIIISILIISNIFFTYSRNATVGFMIGFIVLAVIYNFKLLSIFTIFVPIVLFDKTLISRFSNIKMSVLNDPRIKLWKVAGKMIKENPILGVGNGNYVARYDEYVKKYPECSYPDYHRFSSHNSYLKVQSELGIFGIGIFFLIILASIKSVFTAYKVTDNNKYKMFLLGVFASIISFLAMNMLDNLFFAPQTTTFFWIFIGLSESILFNKVL